MSKTDALSVVRRYHAGWTSRRYDDAVALLAPSVEVEVPINEYPTAASFAWALRAFGDHVRRVDLLAEMGAGDEAMLLYDMDVERLGGLRVAEHFTVDEGLIVRLRQVHDTTPLRV
jgi:SnoaL-like domain